MDSVYVDALADAILTHSAKKFGFRLYKNADRFSLNEERSRAPGNRTPFEKRTTFRVYSYRKMKLKNNIKAPNFKLPSTDRTIFELSKIKKKNIILYFYPKDDTPGCTVESKDFSKLNNLISRNNSIVLGISKDSIESHLKFKKKYKLKFNLLSDEKLSVIKKYGVWGKKYFLGKKYMGIVRTTFLIKSKGKIHKIWSNVRVKDHAKEVLDELKNI